MNLERILSDELPGVSKGIRQTRRELRAICSTTTTVLLAGEPGTGKTHLARLLHHLANHPPASFQHLDLAEGLPRKFTGNGAGTLFLDHAEKLPVRRGGLRARVPSPPPGVRLVVSLEAPEDSSGAQEMAEALGAAVTVIVLPPLRQRREDLPLLIGHLCRRRSPGSSLRLSPDDLAHLAAHAWPGNVGELGEWAGKRIIDGEGGAPAGSACGTVLASTVASWITLAGKGDRHPGGSLRQLIGTVETLAIRAALERCGGRQVEAAALLGISRNTLALKLKEYGIAPQRRCGRPANGR